MHPDEDILFNALACALEIGEEDDIRLLRRAWEEGLSKKFMRNFNERRSDVATAFREKLYELLGHPRLPSTATPAQVHARAAALAELASSEWICVT